MPAISKQRYVRNSHISVKACATAAAVVVGLLSMLDGRAETRTNQFKPGEFVKRYKASVSKFGGRELGDCRGTMPGGDPLNMQFQCLVDGANVLITVSGGNTVRVAFYVPEDIASPGVFAATAPHIVAAMSSNGDASSVGPRVAALRRVSEQKIGETQSGRFPGATCKFLVQRRVHTNSSMDCEPE